MKRKIAMILITALTVSSISGCSSTLTNNNVIETTVNETIIESTTTIPTTSSTEINEDEINENVIPLNFTVPSLISQPYTPMDVTAKVPDYAVADDLSNIANIKQFPNLTDKQKEMIAKNGFVVNPTESEQLFYIYEDNTYKLTPNFITTDSVLQLYHIFYDFSLRQIEQDCLYEQTMKMNNAMLQDLLSQYKGANTEEANLALKKAITYFTVAAMTLDMELPENIDADIIDAATIEYNNAMDASGALESSFAGRKVDYSLFKIRGHYTKTEELGKYFKAFSWYGVMPLTFKEDTNLLTAMIISDTLVKNSEARQIWDNIYSVTSFMVGESDDINPIQIAELVNNVYGTIPTADELPGKLDDIRKAIDTLPNAKIVKENEKEEMERNLRFMGQRYLPDSDILQQLVKDVVRPIPTGLEIFAVYGSDQAEQLVADIYQPQNEWPEYKDAYVKACEQFRNQTVAEQTSNIYTTWLYTLNQLNTEKNDGYPTFMKNEAWKNKSLVTSLASWTELRHDTILYGKQSGAECGGGEEPPEIIAYVEPDPDFFNRLYWLTENTKIGLEERGLLTFSVDNKIYSMLYLLDFLKECSIKELNGEDLSAEERYSLLTYGGTLEYLSSSIADTTDWYLIESDTDRHMAVIADVHSLIGEYLEEAVGNACEIYVAVPQNGKIYLSRGAVFDYYEFMSEERLTDEQWQDKLKNDPPQRVPYVDTFMDQNLGDEVPETNGTYSTGC